MKRRLLSMFCAFVLIFGWLGEAASIPVKAATEVCVNIDGDTSDWDYIAKYQVDALGFSQVAAFSTQDGLYIMRDLADISDYGVDQIFIDADGDDTNGYLNQGIDYMIQGQTLYTYTGSNGAWGWGGAGEFTVSFGNGKASAEYYIPRTSLGKTTGEVKVNIGSVKKDWSYLASYPASSSSLISVPSYDEAYQESVSEPISDITFIPNGKLEAISENTMEGGVVGTFTAKGGNGEFSYALTPSAAYGVDNDLFIIKEDKLIVKKGLLSPGNYNIYVKASSDIRSNKQAISFVVDAAAKSTPITENVFTGKNGQWFAVNHNAANSIPTLTQLKAVTDGVNLYAYVGAAALSNEAEFYIGTQKSENGMDVTDTWSDATNVKYKVAMDGSLYEYNGDWAVIGNVMINKNGVGAEICVPLSSIGNASGIIKVGIKDGESAVLPNRKKEMFTVTTPIMEDAPVIVADGDISDWAGIKPIAQGCGSVGDLYALRDNDYLYVMSKVTDADFSKSYAVSTNLLINADGDSSTGYLHGAYTKGSGADFLVQDWFSNTVGSEERNVEFFYTESSTGGWQAVAGHTAYKVFNEAENEVYIEFAIPIADMMAVSEAVSDDMYIAIHRGDPVLQPGTVMGSAPAGESFAAVPKFKTRVNVSVEDNSFGDWNTVSNKVSNTATESLCNLYATKSSERLYTLVTSQIGGLNTVNTYYVSTGESTGYEFSGYRNIDYIIRNAKLYKVTGDDTLSEELSDVWMSYYNDSIEMQLYLESIGNPETIQIAWRGVDGSVAIPGDDELLTVNATFPITRDENFYYPVEDFGSYANPYKGWVLWATKSKEHEAGDYYFDLNTVYLGIRWSEFEPVKGQYNYGVIEDKFNLSYWKSKGIRVNLRFLMDNPEVLEAGESQRMDIPKWLYDELVMETEKGNIKNPGTFYNDVENLGGAGFSPNYNSTLLIEYHDQVIKALAEYFDKTEITSFVQIGSLGHWGEFHTWPEGSGEFPSPEVATRYMEAYTKNFKNVKLGLRKPYPYAAQNGFGLFNDVFGVTQYAATDSFLGFILNGDTDMGPLATAEDVAASAMPEFWKTNYSGGEFASGEVRAHVTNDTAADGSKGIIGCMNQVRSTHVSWLGPCSPADIETKEIAAPLLEANILALQKLMGYNFALEKIARVGELKKGSETPITMVWNNEGVAPFYYQWPVEISLIDQAGNVAFTQEIYGDITSWLPGRNEVTLNLLVDPKTPNGTYTLAIAINDLDSHKPAMHLAIAGGREDLRYPLYQVNVTGSSVVPGGNGGHGNVHSKVVESIVNWGREVKSFVEKIKEIPIVNKVLTWIKKAATGNNKKETEKTQATNFNEIGESNTPLGASIEAEEAVIGAETAGENMDAYGVELTTEEKNANKALPITLAVVVALICVAGVILVNKLNANKKGEGMDE